jgi:hypothetical protein
LEQRLDGIEETLKKLAHTLEKSTIPSFPSHDIIVETSLDTSATNGPIQSQPLYGMTLNSYLGQPLPHTKWTQQHLRTRPDRPRLILDRPTLYHGPSKCPSWIILHLRPSGALTWTI